MPPPAAHAFHQAVAAGGIGAISSGGRLMGGRGALPAVAFVGKRHAAAGGSDAWTQAALTSTLTRLGGARAVARSVRAACAEIPPARPAGCYNRGSVIGSSHPLFPKGVSVNKRWFRLRSNRWNHGADGFHARGAPATWNCQARPLAALRSPLAGRAAASCHRYPLVRPHSLPCCSPCSCFSCPRRSSISPASTSSMASSGSATGSSWAPPRRAPCSPPSAPRCRKAP